MDEQRAKTQREAFMACEGGTQSHHWWQLGFSLRRARRPEYPNEAPPPDWREQQRRRENRMRSSLAYGGGFLMRDRRDVEIR